MSIVGDYIRQNEERWKKSIPSKVFSNHFSAINLHLENESEKYHLRNIEYYNCLTINNQKFNIEVIRKLLWNAWSTEYAFFITRNTNSQDYYKFALHWNFPQAYYSVYLAMTAFHETQGIANDNHEKSIKIFGNSVKDNHYPKVISFYSKGLHENFQYINLDKFNVFPHAYNGLKQIDEFSDYQTQIAFFLKSTRVKNADHKRVKLINSNDTRFQNAKKQPLKKFTGDHWNLIYQTIPVTTVLNMLYRLRIKANYHDIETFINADINFQEFHKSLGSIISYLNFVHEAYIVKCIGTNDYERILNTFPKHLNEFTALYRYEKLIKNI